MAMIYQHGHFSAHDTAQTALALQAYSVGLAGYAATRVATPCFLAMGEPGVPMRISLIGIGLNLVLNFANARVLHLGHAGLALTTSVVALVNFAQLSFALSRRIDVGRGTQWAGFLTRCGLAAGACAGAAWWLNGMVERATESHLIRYGGLGVAIGISLLVYFAVARALRLDESAQAWAMVKRRLPGFG